MSFTQQPVNYAVQYSRDLANAYPYLSYYGDLWGQGEAVRFRPLSGKVVMIPSMTTSGARAANRDQITGVFNRNWNVEWQPCNLEMDREWGTLVDPMDMVQTDEVATIANVTRTFIEQQKIPEMDAYASSKLAAFARGFGGTDATELSAANILTTWDSYLAYMANQRIDRRLVRCKMTPGVYKLLKEAAGITRFVDVGNGIQGVDRNIARLDGVGIQEVPDELLKTAYDFTNGWEVDAVNASQINMLFYDLSAVAAPVVYETSMISPPTAQSKGKWLYYERYYYGMFGLRQRQAGVFANVSAPTIASLNVTSVAGSAAGATTINATGAQIGQLGTAPEGLEMYYTAGNNSAPSVSYGSALPGGVTWTKVNAVPFTLTSQTANKYVTVALVNKQTGYAVAVGSAVEVVGV